ncbi:vimentin-type intermediate filament-associated coiled-coil protein isoform X2 [Dipodomys spectabilis]|uniref:vimentin-type intermediate filament-associated coiled-coil protein isoform X2 n=1 Tax=Dipodomys spectabilis TaxID=105255 RepID=UPI001C5416B8|nr:vimentin-type intermediate filament-associated coiled-coil protein isoform X2 [Dipodomys spectabilis]
MSAPPALQIREANAHLAAVHRRAAELEARLEAAERTVRAQAERLSRQDQQQRTALEELGRAKDRLRNGNSRSLVSRFLCLLTPSLGAATPWPLYSGNCQQELPRGWQGLFRLESLISGHQDGTAFPPDIGQWPSAVVRVCFLPALPRNKWVLLHRAGGRLGPGCPQE